MGNRVLYSLVIGFLCAISLAGCMCNTEPQVRSGNLIARAAFFPIISVEAAYRAYLRADSIFVDARPSAEFKKQHIPSAISIPFEELDQQFGLLDDILSHSNPVVVYCSTSDCDDALLLAQVLCDIGKTNVSYFKEGFSSWKQADYPTE